MPSLEAVGRARAIHMVGDAPGGRVLQDGIAQDRFGLVEDYDDGKCPTFSSEASFSRSLRVRLWVRQRMVADFSVGLRMRRILADGRAARKGRKKCHAPQEGAMRRFKPSMRGKRAAFAVRSVSSEVELPASSVFTRLNNRTGRDSSRTRDACQARFAPSFGRPSSGRLVRRRIHGNAAPASAVKFVAPVLALFLQGTDFGRNPFRE